MSEAKPVLYLFIGYPGAGKTTTARRIAALTDAKHLWADFERHRLFPNPTHSKEESDELYRQLNAAAEYLLAQGKSVVFDTNFNFHTDRQLMREIAARHKAKTVIIWVTTPLEKARKNAVGTREQRNGYAVSMTLEQFARITSKLEEPTEDENVIKIDDPKLDDDALLKLLNK